VARLRAGRADADARRLDAAATVLARNTLVEDLPAFFTTGAYAEHLVTPAA
jgi:malate synthase